MKKQGNNSRSVLSFEASATAQAKTPIWRRSWMIIGLHILLLSVAGLRGQPNTNSLLAPAHGEMPPSLLEWAGTAFQEHPAGMIIGSLLLVLLVALAFWRIFKPKPLPVVSPETSAREALANLVGQLEDGRLLSQVSQILRRYIINRLNLPNGEWTTAELISALTSSNKMEPKLGSAIAGFLNTCDVQKFSPPGKTPPLNAANQALALLDRMEQHLISGTKT